MTARFIYKQDRINISNTGTDIIKRGDIVVTGNMVGVALTNVAPNETGVIMTEGIFDIDAVAADVIAVGDAVYYDAEKKLATKTKGTGTPCLGYAIQAKAAADDSVVVRLVAAVA